MIPLVVLIGILMAGYTPYLAAFWGITLCIAVGLLNPRKRMSVGEILAGLRDGAKYALAVGAAAATVGIVVGVVTLTGVGFKISFIVTTTRRRAGGLGRDCAAGDACGPADADAVVHPDHDRRGLHPDGLRHPHDRQLHHHGNDRRAGAGSVGCRAIVAHFFVFYYGVLADITPPVALAAYAAAGMAGADPFKTGNTAFRLGLGKALVPFVFVFSPSLLLVAAGLLLDRVFHRLHRLCRRASPAWVRRSRVTCWCGRRPGSEPCWR